MSATAKIKSANVIQVDIDDSEKKEEIPFIIKNANKITKVSTAAITWLSVIDEINTPIARFAQPRRKNPRIAVYAAPKDISPNPDMISGYVHMIRTGTAKTVTRARYFPITISATVTGAVRRS